MSQEVIQWNDSTEVQGHKVKNKKKRVKNADYMKAKYRCNWVITWILINFFVIYLYKGLCSSSARWLLLPYFCSWVIRKSSLFHKNNSMLGTLDYTGLEHWALFIFS